MFFEWLTVSQNKLFNAAISIYLPHLGPLGICFNVINDIQEMLKLCFNPTVYATQWELLSYHCTSNIYDNLCNV